MGLKENVEALKQELSTEEQFLESVIKAEGFFKKYKKVLIAAAVAVIAGTVLYLTMDYLRQRDLTLANEALATLQKNPADSAARKKLQDASPGLYEMFLFSEAAGKNDTAELAKIAQSSPDPVLKDLATYQNASLKEDADALSAYSEKDAALLKEVALLDEAYLLFRAGKGDEARKRLAQIPLTSQMQGIVQSFRHYMKAGE